MRLDTDAVIYKGGGWYDGNLSGFSFRIDSKIEKALDVTHISGHVSLANWLKNRDIEDEEHKIAATLMRNVKIYAKKDKNVKVSSQVGTGVEKLFIYTGTGETYDFTKMNRNFLCAQCIWTCKQGRDVKLYSCKAFDVKKPKEEVGGL